MANRRTRGVGVGTCGFLAAVAIALGSARPLPAQEWHAADVVAEGADLQLAFNATQVAVRDAEGALHVIWSQGDHVRHGRRAVSSSAWEAGPLPRLGSSDRTARKKATKRPARKKSTRRTARKKPARKKTASHSTARRRTTTRRARR